ncbi:uncharacterized protein LOC130712652 [Lotus japonicus]|uniref:uncharacterized protein LOC130712652 n=1 Tax=Lotus japonicus TaxID=34305 RepID=UPI002584D26A|nr:uncharacterized protein LOC130712652 [Lotus japonicus]
MVHPSGGTRFEMLDQDDPEGENDEEQRRKQSATVADIANFDLRFRCTWTSAHSEVSTVGTLATSTTRPISRIVVPSPSTAAAAAFGSSFRSTPATDGKTEDTATILAVRRANHYLQFRIWVILFDDPDNHRRPSAELSGQTVDSLGKRTAPLSFWPRKDEGTTYLCVSGDSSSVNPVSRNFLWRLFADKFQKLDFRTMNGSTLHRSYTMEGIEPTQANKDVIGSELHLSMEIGQDVFGGLVHDGSPFGGELGLKCWNKSASRSREEDGWCT